MCIFTQQLYLILQKHKKDLNHLHGVYLPGREKAEKRQLPGVKIERMQKIIREKDYSQSTTLNPNEIEAVGARFAFTEREMERLRSALAGEFIFRYLLDRTGDIARALRAGNYMFHLLFDVQAGAFPKVRQALLTDIRPIDPSDKQIALELKKEADLAPCIELYEEAMLCLEAAERTKNQFIRDGYKAMALSLLTNADELITYPSDLLDGSAEQAAWKELVTLGLDEAKRVW